MCERCLQLLLFYKTPRCDLFQRLHSAVKLHERERKCPHCRISEETQIGFICWEIYERSVFLSCPSPYGPNTSIFISPGFCGGFVLSAFGSWSHSWERVFKLSAADLLMCYNNQENLIMGEFKKTHKLYDQSSDSSTYHEHHPNSSSNNCNSSSNRKRAVEK